MNKFVSFMLIFFFTSGTFTVACNSVLASELIEDSWYTKTPMTQARAGLGVVAVDGKIYAIGGQADDGFVGTNERYDPKTDKWVNLKPMPTPRANFAIATYQGEIYCIGGESREGVYNGVEVYDVATDNWSTKQDISFDGLGLQAHVADGKIFVIKKQDFSWETGYSSFATDLYLYTLSTDEWTQKAIPHTDWIATGSALISSVSVTMDDKIMIYFKYIEPGNLWYDIFDKAMIYDPKTNTWREAITPPNTLGFPARTLDRVFGGCMTSGIYAPKDVYFFQEKRTTVYDPVKTAWSDVASMPESRIDFGVAVVNDIMYVIGGKNVGEHDDDFFSINEQYIPKDYSGTIPPVTSPATTPTPNSNTLIIGIATVAVIAVATTGILITKKKQKVM